MSSLFVVTFVNIAYSWGITEIGLSSNIIRIILSMYYTANVNGSELSPRVKAVNMGLSLCFLFCEFFFFFQRENETQKPLCVLEGHSLQSEKCGIWAKPLKLPEQRNT